MYKVKCGKCNCEYNAMYHIGCPQCGFGIPKIITTDNTKDNTKS